MMKHFGVTPYLVFDGDFLPSKAGEEASRAKRREQSREAGLALLKAGKPSQAHRELQKAIDITPEMARALIDELEKHDIPYVVAPYEADAQLVYLERQGIISGIVTEDSDLLVFGAKRLITKLEQHGQCVEINRRDFAACREVSLTGWTDAQFRHMAIFSGCDYLEGIKAFGLKTAHRMIRQYKTPAKVVKMLQFSGKYQVPADYLKLFQQAEMTFLYQRVYCPKAEELVFLNPLPADLDVDAMPYIGAAVEPHTCKLVASGRLNPMTKKEISPLPLSPSRKRRASSNTGSEQSSTRRQSETRASRAVSAKPIESYFSGDRRIPLGNMDPNCFNVDSRRASTSNELEPRPIVFPLPRPYVGEEASQPSQTPRPYVSQSAVHRSQTMRRQTDPVSNLLINGGTGLGSSSRRQTAGPATILSDSGSGGTAPPAKKPRLCDSSSFELTSGKEKSKFFPVSQKQPEERVQADDDLSDDSVEEAMRDLPDVDSWHAAKAKKEVLVYKEPSEEPTRDTPKDDEEDTEGPISPISSNRKAVPSKTPLQTAMSRFAFNQSQQSTASIRSSGRTPASSASTSTVRSTPASSGSLMTASYTNASTPATPFMTPLQRLGSQALRGGKPPPTPTFSVQRPHQRSSKGRGSLEAIPVNAAFVPLPPVDLEEVESLHKQVGSEDLLVPESENEDGGDDAAEQENMGKGRRKATRKSLDLSRFLYC